MIENRVFDEVHDCQEAFRLLLKALSNPGEIVDTSPLGNLNERNQSLFLFALTIMDKESSFCVIGDEELADRLKNYTYSMKTKIDEADFLFVPELCSDDMIKDVICRVKPGTLIEPHTNCALVIKTDAIPEEAGCILYGPGINGVRAAKISDYAQKWIKARDEMDFEYPMGIDMYFVTEEGKLFALPRKVKRKDDN